MTAGAGQPNADLMAWSSQQFHPCRGGCRARDPSQQSPRPQDGVVHGDALESALAELQLLPPATGAAGNHRCRHHTLSSTSLLKSQKTAQALVVSFQKRQPGFLFQIGGRRDPFPLS